jgi:nucleoid DNA-binding protein
MKKPEIARRIARQGRMSCGEAADHLDRVVNEILSSLKRGKPAEMPGLGSFRQTSGGRIRFDQEGKPRG